MPTFIAGPVVGAVERADCGRLNGIRARLIVDTAKGYAPGEQASADVWFGAVAGRTAEWNIPLIPLDQIPIIRDNETGSWSSSELTALTSGQEVYPFHDRQAGVVYKLFDLKGRGFVGKKLCFERLGEHEFDLVHQLATLSETLEKICVLHDAGALPTEIVGLADSGDCLIVKQPYAQARPYSSGIKNPDDEKLFVREREEAIEAIKGIIARCPGLRQTAALVHVGGRPWFVGDLHVRNIMLDSDGRPAIIDALTGSVLQEAVSVFPQLGEVSRRARAWRETGVLLEARSFHDGDDRGL